MLVIDGSDSSEGNLKEIESVCERYGEMLGRNTVIVFNKNDREEFSIVPFIDLLKGQGFFREVLGVEEVNVLEPGLAGKLFRLVRRRC